jgi:hypothetical protein
VIVNIDEATPKLEVGNNNFINKAQQGLANGNLFSLLHLLVRKIKGRKPLIYQFQNHVVTPEEYLNRL